MGETVDWGDSGTSKEFGADDVERYRGRERFKDKIRILSKPVKYYTHSLERKFVNCSKTEGRCLLCERGYDRNVKVGCVVVHIAERNNDNPSSGYVVVGTCKVWLFGKDKWESLTGLIDDYPELAKDLRKHDLIISCSDEVFQKLEIRPTLQESLAKKEMTYNAKQAQKKMEFYTSPSDLDKQKEFLGMDAEEEQEKQEQKDDLVGDITGDSEELESLDNDEVTEVIEKRVEEIQKEENNEVDDLLDELGET